MHPADRLIDRCLAASPEVRYVAVYRNGELRMRERAGLTGASSSESDRYEELLVNPTLLTLARQRGEIDCGGLEWILLRYGHFFTVLIPVPGGHVNVGLELAVDLGRALAAVGEVVAPFSSLSRPGSTSSCSSTPSRVSDVAIRVAAAADAAALSAFGERTFRDAFGAANRPEDIDAYVAETYGVARQAIELADPGRTTLVGVAPDGTLAGYAQLRVGSAPAAVRGAHPIELLRFYVDRPWQGRGVAQTLMTAALEAARARSAATVWLGVWEQNPRAIAFYRKCGFRVVGRQEFVLGTDRQTDCVMERALGHVPESPPSRS